MNWLCSKTLRLKPQMASLSIVREPTARKYRASYLVISCFIPFLLFLCSACNQQQSSLTLIKQRGSLNVVTRNGPTTFYQEFEHQGSGHTAGFASRSSTGFEYELAREFAHYLGVELNMYNVYGRDDIFRQLDQQLADLAAAGLILDTERLSRVRYSTAYLPAEPRIIYKIGSTRPKTVEDLIDKKITVAADSYYASHLLELKKHHPKLDWAEAYDLETIDLLEKVLSNEIDYTIVSEHEFLALRGIYANLSMSLRLGGTQQLAWALPRQQGHHAELYNQIDEFMQGMKSSGRLAELSERYFGHSKTVDQVSALAFAANIKQRLPKYETLIRTVATEFGLRWELLAAISYQESLWNPEAVSPTGVRGMMMLTAATAAEVNIEDRSNLEQSLRGGAEYFLDTKRRMPEDILEPDRTWFALAAYNVGMGHLEDARVITETQNRNPDKWVDVREFLPLLRQRAWYSKTKYGYARGNEPVTYVQNIRHYYSVLRQQEIANRRVRPPIELSHRAPKQFSYPIPAI